MNLPNKLTVFRVFLIPVFVAFMLIPFNGKACEGIWTWLSLLVFVVASLTDLFDGKIARKYNLVTNFGKFADPLADKLLVCAAMICLVKLDRIPAWIVIVIVSREFVISGLRLVAAESGVVIAAGIWGKVKTVFQMIMVIMMILNWQWFIFPILTQIVMWIALVLTIVSLVDYIVKNLSVFKMEI